MKTVTGPSEAAVGRSEHSIPPFPLRVVRTMMAATFLWSSNVVAVKFAVQELPQVTVAVLRVTLAAVTLVLLHLLRGGSLRLGKGERWSFLKFSLFGLSLSFLFFTVGVSYTSVSHTVFVAALGPLVVFLFARWEGQERITLVKVAGLLLSLAGVARKTANCVLGTWFGHNVGGVVDTHVGRLALRLRLLTTARDDKDAVRIEQDLMKLFPRESWTYLSHALIQHGRRVCDARKPDCASCTLAGDCPSAATFQREALSNKAK